MTIIKSARDLTEYLSHQKSDSKKIGFVPTMGALHDGHLSLMRLAKNTNAVAVCSIFINPTQFNNPNDFTHYPITIEKDIERLLAVACDILFLPPKAEIYAVGYQAKHYHLGRIEHILEGHFRPGHFQGVCQVVDRLLEIVPTDTLYLGQKDYQQCMVIKRLLELTDRKEKIIVEIAPTLREKNGLAMSSRNLRLSQEQLHKAEAISKNLLFLKNNIHQGNLEQARQTAQQDLTNKGLVVDYVEIANANTLETANNIRQPLVALIAASIDGIRLIDNMLLN